MSLKLKLDITVSEFRIDRPTNKFGEIKKFYGT